MSAAPVNVDAVLDAARFRGLPLLVCACTFAIMVLDGFDIQIIGFAAPALVAEFGIERSALAPALAASVLGMSIGAVGAGPIGDRWGRRPALLLSTGLFATATLLAATATNVESLAAWRFITGLGLGGALPGAVTLMAEFSPARRRSQMIVGSLLGVPIGGIVGAALAAELVPVFGWRMIFLIGGVLPLLAAAALAVVLPESPRFLATRPGRASELARVLNGIAGNSRYGAQDQFALTRPTPAMRGPRALFVPGLARETVLAALAFLANMFAVYAFFNWMPLVLNSIGFALDQAVRSALVFNLAGVAGSVINAWAISRIGSRAPLAAFAGIALFALLSLAWASAGSGAKPDTLVFFAGIAAAGFGIHALQMGLYIVCAHVFPTQCRTSGVGFASGAGRLGGIISSFAGGILLAQAGAAGFFAGVAIALALTAVCLHLLRGHVD
jgi:MFS transporter, AAHS family, 4-hydroxybenzoate transporter